MNTELLNTISQNFENAYKFLFETYAGIGILVGGCIIITLFIAIILEIRTKNKFRDRAKDNDETEATND